MLHGGNRHGRRRPVSQTATYETPPSALAGKIFHGKKGEPYQRYYKGMEDQLGALGLALNCVTLWNTFYMDRALERLRLRATRWPAKTLPGCRRSSASTST
ncbi:Tn3 family transposase [Nonomuraea sp. NPDC049158]|uniref:Tn3 family transposase n=1 Tax=Nonomuraea sp. NPDC049158 TaxID=3155649 RepID=UPI0034101542